MTGRIREQKKLRWCQGSLVRILTLAAAVLLFGSRVDGTAREYSDIDVLVLSSRFRGIPLLKRMPMLLRIARFEKQVDYLCYTAEEFAVLRDKSVILREADCVVYPRSTDRVPVSG